MKRYITILLCMITGFLSFSSCDDKNDPDTIKGDRELYLSALVDGLGIDAATYRFQGGHGVGFWLSSTDVNGNLNQADIAVNNQFLQSAGGLVSEPRTNWSKSGELFIYGYSPYDKEAIKTPEAYPFQLDLRQDSLALTADKMKRSDFLWTKRQADYSTEPVQLAFHHLMCKVILHIKSNSTTPGSFAGCQVSLCNTCTSAVIDLGTGIVTPNGNPENIIAAELLEVPEGYETTKEAIIIPQTVTVGTEFLSLLTLGNYTCTWYADKDLTLESGKQITMEVIIDEGECDVVIKEIANWNEDGALIMGEANAELPSYKLFDFYNRNGLQGIVIDTDETGKHGWIVSLGETQCYWCSSVEFHKYNPVCTSTTDSEANLNGALAVDSTLELYPAMKWCNDKNKDGVTGWVLPAFDILKKFYCVFDPGTDGQYANYDAFNDAIDNCPVNAENKNKISDVSACYGSSTLSITRNVKVIQFYPYYGEVIKSQPWDILTIRAFHKF